MQCNQCKEREAVVHLTQIADDQVVTVHLCERCAAEKGVESSGNLGKTPIGSFLASMGKALDSETGAGDDTGLTCAGCGATLNDFRETGRLGCPECYRTFESQLRELLRRLHGSSRHLGERYEAPGGTPTDPLLSHLELRERLRLAVETENFELAAELRDRLKGVGERVDD
jgi:protein arginine kinase activator